MIELPQVIWSTIYSYDSTYRLIYNDVIDEFNQINNFWGFEFTHPKIEEAIIPILPTLIDSKDDLINDIHLRFDIESVKKIFYLLNFIVELDLIKDEVLKNWLSNNPFCYIRHISDVEKPSIYWQQLQNNIKFNKNI